MNKGKMFLLTSGMVVSILASGCGSSKAETSSAVSSASQAAGASSAAEAVAASSKDAGSGHHSSSIASSEFDLDSLDTSKVASKDEQIEQNDLEADGLTPVSGSQVVDGTYEISVRSSSDMFKVDKCMLSVKDGRMTAVLTMSGSGYLLVYPGTAEEAAAADKSDMIKSIDNADGKNTFMLTVENLNQEMNLAAFSKNKLEWYPRKVLFDASSLPEGTVMGGDTAVTAEELGLADGTYTAEAKLAGGSGRASITSPMTITITGGQITGSVEMSSNYYDYAIVNGEKYLPVNTEGNSTFEVPFDGFDYAMPFTADTTRMSTPHEIDYTITLDSTTAKAAE